MTIKRPILPLVCALAAAAVATGYVAGKASASGIAAKNAMTYSGVLTDLAGAPLSGSKNVEVKLWNDATDGTLLCDAGPAAADLVGGAFELTLPDTCTAAVHSNASVWTEVFVDGASVGRTSLGSVPYAVEADTASNAAGPLNQRMSTLETRSTQPGTVIAFAGSTCPTSTIPADGRSLLRTGASAGLYAAIGTNWGSADATHFNVPNLINRFLRGIGAPTDGYGGDPVALGKFQEAATHVYKELVTGGQSANHSHSTLVISPNGEFGGVNGGPNPGGFHTVGDNGGTQTGAASNDHAHTVVSGQGDPETRPKSYGVLYCVYL